MLQDNIETVDYKEMLIMIYLKDYGDEYLLAEICSLCDLTTNQLTRMMQKLEKKGLVSSEKSIKLSVKAKNYLVDNGYGEIDMKRLQEDIVTLDIKNPQLSFEDIYIPVNFKP